MITLKLTFQQMEAFTNILSNDVDVLIVSHFNLHRLAALVIKELRDRVRKKINFGFTGTKTVKLNEKECLALHQFIMLLSSTLGGEYYHIIRREVFQKVDSVVL